MAIQNIDRLFGNRKMVFASFVITLISLLLCFIIATSGYKSGYLIIGAILYLGLCVISLINFKVGFYISITFGFLIFLLGRVSLTTIPLGILVDLPLYLGFISFFTNKSNKADTSQSIPIHVISVFMIIILIYNFMYLY